MTDIPKPAEWAPAKMVAELRGLSRGWNDYYAEITRAAADTIEQLARHVRIAGEALATKEKLNGVLREQVDELKGRKTTEVP